ncbi:MAG: hypothetical protein V3U83_00435, partial [Acidobacteriota bacterium]
MNRNQFLALLLPALLLLGLPSAIGADKEESDPIESLFVERATTELILIEVYVTDSKGRPIRGLTIDDFVLKVERRRKPIESVEYFEVTAPPAPA